MRADTAEAFLDLYRRSELFDAAGYSRRFPGSAGLPPDPRGCADALVRAGLLTSYQAGQLLQGRRRGFLLGSYKVLEPLGKGGMGTVFLAEHTAMKRKVALKVIRLDKATDKLALERFHREARSAAALDHPNIVRLFDVGQHAKIHYLAMEFVEGETLDRLLTREPPHCSLAVSYAAQAAEGLQHAHERGLVHRDVKPSNLILARDGTVKLLDMGLARSYQEEADNLTAALGAGSDAVGTVDYVSPEQSLNAEVDVRSDIYSLGATLFALVAGRPPFQGTTIQKLAQLQTVAPPPLSSLRPGAPEGLSRVVARMMAKAPSQRFASATEVLTALAPWLPPKTASRSGTARRPEAPAMAVILDEPGPRPREPARAVILDEPRRAPAWPVAALAAAGVLFAALCLAGVGLLFFRSAPPPPAPAAPMAEAVSVPTPHLPVAAPPAVAAPPTAERPVDPRFSLYPLEKVGTATTRRPLFSPDDPGGTVVLPSGPLQVVAGVPFRIAPALGGRDRNLLLLHGTRGTQATDAPSSVVLPIGSGVVAFHFLGGVGGCAWPWRAEGGPDLKGKVALKLRVRYADGAEEEHAWRNGEEVADWSSPVEVPGSRLAFVCQTQQQMRCLTLRPRRPGRLVKELVLEKGEVPELANLIFALTLDRGRQLYGLDFASLRPHSFECGVDGKPTPTGGSGTLPIGWTYSHAAGSECRSAFSCEVIDGRAVLGFRKLEGSSMPQLHSMAFGTLAADRPHLLRLEHRGEANFAGHLQLRRKLSEGENLPHRIDLGPTGGAWRLTELEIVPAEKHPLILALQNTSREAEQNGFQLRLIEVVDVGKE